MPHKLEVYETVLQLDTCYAITKSATGAAARLKPVLEVFRTAGVSGVSTLYESLFFDRNYLNINEGSRQMSEIRTGFAGIFIFEYIPNFIFLTKLSGDDNSLISSGLDVKRATTIPIESSLTMRGGTSEGKFLSLQGLGGETDFPLSNSDSDTSADSWSVRSIFKLRDSFEIIAYINTVQNESVRIIVGENLINDKRNKSGHIRIRYGLSDDTMTFGTPEDANDFKNLLYDKWYQLVVTFDGLNTSTPANSVLAFNAYLTDMETQETVLLSKSVDNTTIQFQQEFTFQELESKIKGEPNLSKFGSADQAILDVWDGEMDQTDIEKLASNQEYAISNTLISSATLFKGWAMGNVTEPSLPFLHDYNVFVKTGIIDPSNTYRFDTNKLDAKDFSGGHPPNMANV